MPAEPHIRSPLQSGEYHNPSFLGHRARESGSTLYDGILQPLSVTVRPPGSNGADQASWNSIMLSPSGMPQTGFTIAPAGISPWLIYLERAISSLRASATMEMRRIRPRSEPTRWRNQQLRALAGWYLTHIQASSIIVVRSLRDALFVVDAATLP